MFLEILLFLFLGVGAGVLTGLIPGLHPNTLFAVLLMFLPLLMSLPLHYTLAFIVSLSVCNTFTNFIPSILFGAPEDSSALSVLPGHRMLLAGNGYEALLLTVIGGLSVIILTTLTFPLLIFIIPLLFNNIHAYIHILLFCIFVWMVITEQGSAKFSAVLIFLLSGTFGLISLTTLPSQLAIFPALTGLFGLSTLFVSLMHHISIPEQSQSGISLTFARGSIAGWLSGLVVGLLPGIGAAQAGVMSAQLLKTKTKNFLVSLGGINTANILFTFIALYTIGKTRSGAAFTVSQLTDSLTFLDVVFVMAVAVAAGGLAAFTTMSIGKFLMNRMRSIPYATLTKAIIIGLMGLVVLFTGPLGLLVTAVGTLIGLTTILMGIRRTHMMGFFMVPTMLFFAGVF